MRSHIVVYEELPGDNNDAMPVTVVKEFMFLGVRSRPAEAVQPRWPCPMIYLMELSRHLGLLMVSSTRT